ncbi:MAG TPA: butyrate kinase, partial [Thermosipho africanus]|nr:butyrate kinase [Thermosipho africanus]
MYRILVINPGSTSTKLAIFEDEKQVASKTLRHTPEELSQFKRLIDQYEFRVNAIEDFLKTLGFEYKDFNAVVGRGGLVRPIPSGTYLVDELMVEELKQAKYGEHASNLGAVIAFEIS